MSDLQVISFQDLVRIRKVTRLEGTSPTVYRVVGADFRSVSEVLLNSMPAPVFHVLSRHELLVEEPQLMRNKLSSISVLSSSITMTEQSVLRPRVGTATLSGLAALAQLFTKILLTTPGRDVFTPELGGGLLKLVGVVSGSPDHPDLKTQFIQAVARTKDQIINSQAGNPRLPLEERMAAATVVSVSFEPETGTLQGRVEVRSVSGEAAVVNLVA